MWRGGTWPLDVGNRSASPGDHGRDGLIHAEIKAGLGYNKEKRKKKDDLRLQKNKKVKLVRARVPSHLHFPCPPVEERVWCGAVIQQKEKGDRCTHM